MQASQRKGVCPAPFSPHEVLFRVFDHFINISVLLIHELSRIPNNDIELSFSWVFKMSSNQTPSADSDPPKFHRLFKFYDPEVVALMAILLGLIQLLLTAPTYNISLDINFLYICPLCVGSVSVIAGSFGMASERTPKRDLLKYCLICGLAGLVGTLIGLVLYSYAASTSLNIPSCSSEYSENSTCPDIIFQSLYKAISGQLVFYNIATLVIHCFLLFSAFKGLRKH